MPKLQKRGGKKFYNMRIDWTVPYDDWRTLVEKLLPKHTSYKEALPKIMTWLLEHETQGLPGKDHLFTEAYHAQTKGIFAPEGWEPPRLPGVTKEDIRDAARSTLQQLIQQDPGAVLRELAGMLGAKERQ